MTRTHITTTSVEGEKRGWSSIWGRSSGSRKTSSPSGWCNNTSPVASKGTTRSTGSGIALLLLINQKRDEPGLGWSWGRTTRTKMSMCVVVAVSGSGFGVVVQAAWVREDGSNIGYRWWISPHTHTHIGKRGGVREILFAHGVQHMYLLSISFIRNGFCLLLKQMLIVPPISK